MVRGLFSNNSLPDSHSLCIHPLKYAGESNLDHIVGRFFVGEKYTLSTTFPQINDNQIR